MATILPEQKFFENKYNIENQSFNFDRNVKNIKLLEKEIESEFSIDSKLKIESNIYYEYNNLEKDLYRLSHKYQFYDNKNILFHEIILNSYDSGEYDFSNNIIYIHDKIFC